MDENMEQFYIALAEETYDPLIDLIVAQLCRILSKRTKFIYGIDVKDIHRFITDDFNAFLLLVQKEDVEDLINKYDTFNKMGSILAQRMYQRLDFSNVCPYSLKNSH